MCRCQIIPRSPCRFRFRLPCLEPQPTREYSRRTTTHWLDLVTSEGDRFLAIAQEDGGATNEDALELLESAVRRGGGTVGEQQAMRTSRGSELQPRTPGALPKLSPRALPSARGRTGHSNHTTSHTYPT